MGVRGVLMRAARWVTDRAMAQTAIDAVRKIIERNPDGDDGGEIVKFRGRGGRPTAAVKAVFRSGKDRRAVRARWRPRSAARG